MNDRTPFREIATPAQDPSHLVARNTDELIHLMKKYGRLISQNLRFVYEKGFFRDTYALVINVPDPVKFVEVVGNSNSNVEVAVKVKEILKYIRQGGPVCDHGINFGGFVWISRWRNPSKLYLRYRIGFHGFIGYYKVEYGIEQMMSILPSNFFRLFNKQLWIDGQQFDLKHDIIEIKIVGNNERAIAAELARRIGPIDAYLHMSEQVWKAA